MNNKYSEDFIPSSIVDTYPEKVVESGLDELDENRWKRRHPKKLVSIDHTARMLDLYLFGPGSYGQGGAC